jgi:glycosyltransferase involved in cell wall biosynthesis
MLSIITTCKGRLAHLQQSLPRMAGHPNTEVIVVDYDCPERAGDWVAAEYPEVRVVRVSDAPTFNISHARNLGAQSARGQWLGFVDADILLAQGFVEQALPLLREGAFYLVAHRDPQVVGTVFCARTDYVASDGYDEVLQGWGAEDRDFYARLGMLGRAQQRLPGAWFSVIQHGSDDRVRHYETKDRWLNQRIGALYAQIKHDLARQLGKLSLPRGLRQTIYDEVRRTLCHAAEASQKSARVQIALPPDLSVRLFGCKLQRVWTYTLEMQSEQPPGGPGS